MMNLFQKVSARQPADNYVFPLLVFGILVALVAWLW